MLRVKEGNGASFGVLLEKHRASAIYFVYRLVQEQAVAEELAQEVVLRGIAPACLTGQCVAD